MVWPLRVSFWLLLTLLAARASDARFVQDRIGIGLWSDPPLDQQADAHYASIAEANFSFVIGNFGASTPAGVAKQLSLGEKYGLKIIVSTAGLPHNQLPTNAACWGYYVADEPGPGAFAGLRQTADSLRAARPGKLAFINMLPDYAPAWALGNEAYPEFMGRFIREVGPDVLSMDHYPHFLPQADGRAAYCRNLEVMREKSLAANIPFWNFFNTMPYGDHSDPTEAQLRWQIYTSLAYGAKGVMYFCYWTPAGNEFPKGGAIITQAGKRTRHFEEAKRINGAVKSLGPTLLMLKSTGVFRVGPRDDAATALQGSGVASISPGDYLVGAFRRSDGMRAVLLNNYEFAYSAWPTVTFDAPEGSVLEISPVDGKEMKVADDSPDMPGLQVSLDAGQGRLFLLPAEKK